MQRDWLHDLFAAVPSLRHGDPGLHPQQRPEEASCSCGIMCEGGASMEQECLTLCGKHESNEVASLSRTNLSLLLISLQNQQHPQLQNQGE